MAQRRWGMRTRAIHAGGGHDPVTGASAPNIVPASTFVLPPGFIDEHAEQGFTAGGLPPEQVPYIYARRTSPTIRQLEARVAALENGEEAVAFGSGIAAISALLLHLLKAGDHLVMSDVAYVGVAEMARDNLPRLGIDVSFVDASDLDELRGALRPTTKLVWIETPVNPMLRLTDIRAVAELAHAVGAELAVDSTWATPVATRPLELGADYVVHSLTKYLCGHGDAMGGAVVGSKEAMWKLRLDTGVHAGGVLSPFNAWLIMRGIDTLHLRMAAHQANALHVARFLEAHPAVTKVLYPGLPSHPQYALAQQQMTNSGGMIAFQVQHGTQLARRMARELHIFHYAVSLGHQRSLVVYIPTDDIQSASLRLDAEHLARYKAYAGEGVFRVSVGLEDPEDLCDDLAATL
jgi:methionine-gamma-lyase